MKNSFYFLLILITYFAISCKSYHYYYYETKKYDADYYFTNKEIPDFNGYDYSIIDTLKDGNFHISEFTNDSILIASIYKNSKQAQIGEHKYYFKNGKIKEIINYNQKGMYNGELSTFYENGNKKRHDFYTNDKLDSGTCWDINGKQIDYFDYVKGPGADLKLLSKQLIYPSNLISENVEEKIVIELLLDSSGIPLKFKYDKNHSKEFIEEIARVIKKYGKFMPAIQDGIPTKCRISIPISFSLND